jgi:hypothetical protein
MGWTGVGVGAEGELAEGGGGVGGISVEEKGERVLMRRGISAVTSRVQIRSIPNKYKHATSDFRFGKHPNKATTESGLEPAAPPALCGCSLWEQNLKELRIMSLSNVRVAPTRTAMSEKLGRRQFNGNHHT